MIKDIKRVDLQGNEYYQESVICNRCKKVLQSTDFYHTIKIAGYHPVKIESGTAYGLSPTEPWHICDDCYKDVSDVLNGIKFNKTTYSTACGEHSAVLSVIPFKDRSTKELKEFRYSFMCSVNAADEIDKILKERGHKNEYM